MIEDPYLANDFELFLINYKSKTNKFILLYDMYSEYTIMNIIRHHLFNGIHVLLLERYNTELYCDISMTIQIWKYKSTIFRKLV